jgi:uncharacterized glyoxalase superfamily protein PhnB/DNA-binding XRE family transcriptional regulator
LRIRHALTQQRLAEVAGVAVREVQRAEDGIMSAETAAALATALAVPVETLTAADEYYPQITPMLYIATTAAVDWLVKAFGLTLRNRIVARDGEVEHAELVLGDGVIMIASPSAEEGCASPAQLDGIITHSLYVRVDDVDEHYARACQHGARILAAPQNFGAHRTYIALDPAEHNWQFWTPLPNG